MDGKKKPEYICPSCKKELSLSSGVNGVEVILCPNCQTSYTALYIAGYSDGYLQATRSGNRQRFEVGDKVTFLRSHNKEHGIVKSIPDDGYPFVVYHCGENWERYADYTAARTDPDDLLKGWR